MWVRSENVLYDIIDMYYVFLIAGAIGGKHILVQALAHGILTTRALFL